MCPKRKPIGIILVIKVTVSLEIPIGVMIYTVGLDSDQRRQSSGAALETIVLRGRRGRSESRLCRGSSRGQRQGGRHGPQQRRKHVLGWKKMLPGTTVTRFSSILSL